MSQRLHGKKATLRRRGPIPSLLARFFFLPFFLFSLGVLKVTPVLDPSPARAAEDPVTVPVTLEQAVSRALAARPDLRAETARVKSAREVVGQARSAEYPQLSASFQTIYGNSLFGFFLFPNYEYEDLNLLTFTLTQDLLDFGKTGSQVDQSRWAYRAEEARNLTLWSQTVRDAESDYFTLLADQHQVLADLKSLEDAELQMARARLRYSTGSGIVLDVTRARVNVEAARLALIRSRDQVRTDSVNLAQIMGMSRDLRLVAQEVLHDPNEILAPDPDRDLPVALSHRPEWKEARANVRAARAGLKNSRSQNYPTLNALFQSFTATLPHGALPFTYIPNNSPYSTFNFGGILTIPLIEGGYMIHQTAKARSDLMAALDTRESVRLQVAADLRKAAIAISDARQQLEEALTEEENAFKNDTLVEEAYREGQVQSVDVMDAQTSLRQARESVIRARYLLMNGYVAYQYARGTITPPGLAAGTPKP
ncbi:MAG: TolC family protein [Nitrospiraceae bacterium]|nr:TolC family protein [Nitrospiraceae bacterium]